MTPVRLDPSQVPAPILEILRRLGDAGHRAYLVGGAVRELLRGVPLQDWDVGTSATPDQVLGLYPDAIATGFHPFDFHTFWWSGHDVAHGHSPYVASLPHVSHRTTFRPFVYPAPAAVAMVPVSLIPYAVANALWFVLGERAKPLPASSSDL